MPRYIAILFALPLLCSCSGDKCGRYNPDTHFCDERDGTAYKYVKIGELLWMAENLNYKAKDSMNSWCNNYNYFNCRKYGRLYDWEAAKQVCPNGWRLPNEYEWQDLMNIFKIDDEDRDLFKKLKSETGWNNFEDGTSGNGTDSLGFSALPGGCRDYRGKFLSVGGSGNWWVTHNANDWWVIEDATLSNSYRIRVNYSEECSKYDGNYDKEGYSIRCVKRDYASDVALAMQIEEKSKTLSNFKDYKDYLDSLFKDKYGAMYKWCNIMKNDPELKSHYLEIISQKDDFLKYYDELCIKAVKYFEQMTTSVEFKYSDAFGPSRKAVRYTSLGRPQEQAVSVTRTNTGALVKYSYSFVNTTKHFEAELSMEEWLEFLKILYKLTNELNPSEESVYVWWTLSINFLDKEISLYKGNAKKHPLDINVLKEAIRNIMEKVRVSAGAEEGYELW